MHKITVEVSTPTSMVLSHKFPVEAAVGSHLFATAMLKTSDGAFHSSKPDISFNIDDIMCMFTDPLEMFLLQGATLISVMLSIL